LVKTFLFVEINTSSIKLVFIFNKKKRSELIQNVHKRKIATNYQLVTPLTSSKEYCIITFHDCQCGWFWRRGSQTTRNNVYPAYGELKSLTVVEGSMKTNRQGSHLLATAKRKIDPHVKNYITRRRGAAWC